METLELIWFMFLKTIINNNFLKKLDAFLKLFLFFKFSIFYVLCFFFKFKNKNYMRTKQIFNIYFFVKENNFKKQEYSCETGCVRPDKFKFLE